MKRQFSSWALLACIATGVLILSGCSTVSSRIQENQAAYNSLSPQDRDLIAQGKIRGGMSQQSVYMSWGAPTQKTTGMVRNSPTETWVYTVSTAAYGPYGYGGYGYGWGYAGSIGFYGHHGRYRYYGAFTDPYWDPFYYPFPASVTYPVKTVSFQGGRVVAFQFLTPGAR